MTIAAIIVAAGKGLRAGGGVPKQWRDLGGRAVAEHTLARIAAVPQIERVVLVLDPDDVARWDGFAATGRYILAPGGADRAASVRSGLQALAGLGVRQVLIHDVARPCVSPALIQRVIAALKDAPAAAPGLPVTDALWVADDGRVSGTRDRSALFAAQTPQGFDYDAIVAAHDSAAGTPAADDVEIARAAGLAVTIVPGEADNLKITTPEDFSRAASILRNAMNIRLGNGFDVHKFGPGDHVTLCGVHVPHDRGLIGHSDADVGLHAVTDAIYGGLARGDIGQHFPPSDPRWKGAASDIFLRHAVALAAEMGYVPGNVDCTLICETPKIGPFAPRMRAVMADIMGIDEDRVSVKATTSEQLGFTGRGEGIAAIATATLVPA
ncbi:MAG: bifunctional 2-C-methyl-D-erythritol 4-phosphate cytidylyltransferase/2-C-methyl-D-erythritol 2,4-cyclodiphosphate synthase [Rhodobacteraceae bacterium]|nr:bifunctional 2-C-methyl-D-erythritol 4-phosphate cytidylyltransferase/2-C-methyl-D-erythritol 2,4-cyclodiphosphate synthase [Paracoccaceae bacterium]